MTVLPRSPEPERGGNTASWEVKAPTFTARQIEIVELMADGKTNKQIAEALSITDGTVKSHLANIAELIDNGNRAGTVGYFFRHGLIS